MEKFLVVGLGNPGPEYQDTRHNFGFMVLDHWVQEHKTHFIQERYGAYSDFKLKGKLLILIKPNTYVNLSGKAVRYWMQNESIEIKNVLVIVDELALPFGALRLKTQGGNAGHNGLKDIEATLGSQHYARLRMGIGRNFPAGGQVEFVLSRFDSMEQLELPSILERSKDIISNFALLGAERTMNLFNSK